MFFNKPLSSGEKWKICGSQVLDVIGKRVLSGVNILVENSIITGITREDISGTDAQCLDLTGYTLIPGMMDSHVHLCLDGGPDAMKNYFEGNGEALRKRVVINLERYLSKGITTVRDAGCPEKMFHLLKAMEDFRIGIFPTVVAAGPAITVKGGHGYYFGLEIGEGNDAKQVVDHLAEIQADFVKIMVTGGSLTPSTNVKNTQFTDAEMSTICGYAKEKGMKISCHVHSLEGVRQCIREKIDSIEHGSYMGAEEIEEAATLGMTYVPTICTAFFVRDKNQGVVERLNNRIKNTKLAFARGMAICAGTDGGIPDVPHGSTAFEIEAFAGQGMEPMEAIRCATCNAAALLGIEGQSGSISEGKSADIVGFRSNPMGNIHMLHQPDFVMKGGSVLNSKYRTERNSYE